MTNRGRPFPKLDFFYIVLMALCAAFLMRDALLSGKVFILKAADCYFSHYSFAHFFKNSVSQGIFPLWYPYSACGTPMGIAGIGNINILHFLSLFFNVDFAWNLRLFLVTFLAGVCTYFYCKKIGLSKFPAFFASVVFMLSAFTRSFTSNYAESSLFFLPLILICVENYASKRNTFWMSLIGLLVALLYFDSNFQFFFYVSLFSFIYTVIRVKSWKAIFPFIIAGGIASFQIIRQFELARLCDRPTFWFVDVLLPQYLLTAIFPFLFESPFRPQFDFFFDHLTREIVRKVFHVGNLYYVYMPFVGITTIIFAFLANRKKFLVKFYTYAVFFVIFFWLTFPALTIVLKHIPFVNKLTAIDRLGVIYTFSLAIAAAFGIERFLSEKINIKKVSLFFSGIAGFIVVSALLVRLLVNLNRSWISDFFKKYIEKNVVGNPNHLASKEFYLERINQFFSFINSWTNIFDPSILLPVIFIILALLTINFYNRGIIKQKLFKLFLTTLVLSELFIFTTYHMTNVASSSELTPQYKIVDFLKKDKEIFRIMPIQNDTVYEEEFPDRKFLAPDSSGIYGISSIESYFNLYIGRFYQLCRSFMKSYDTHILGVVAGGKDNFDLRLADLMNVKYFLTYGGVNLPFPVAYRDSMHTLYLNSNYLPRAFMVYDYEVIPEADKLLLRMKQVKENFNKIVLLESSPGDMVKTSGQVKNKVDIIKYNSGNINLKVFTEKQGLMVLSDSYYPGWKAFVDGVPAKIYIADYAFRAIVVPAGEHEITFLFSPFSFKIGMAISSFFLCIALVLCIKPVKI